MKVEGQSSYTFMDYVTFVCVGGRGADSGTARVAIGGGDEVEGNQRVLVSPGEHHQSQGPPAVWNAEPPHYRPAHQHPQRPGPASHRHTGAAVHTRLHPQNPTHPPSATPHFQPATPEDTSETCKSHWTYFSWFGKLKIHFVISLYLHLLVNGSPDAALSRCWWSQGWCWSPETRRRRARRCDGDPNRASYRASEGKEADPSRLKRNVPSHPGPGGWDCECPFLFAI